jgi:hypothetical protein
MQQNSEPEDYQHYLSHLSKVQEEVKLLREQVDLINNNQRTQTQQAASLQIALEHEIEENSRKDEKIKSYLENIKSINNKIDSVTRKIYAFEKEKKLEPNKNKNPSHNKIRRTLLPTPPNNLPPSTIMHNRTTKPKQPSAILRPGNYTATNIHRPSQALRHYSTNVSTPPSPTAGYYPINRYTHPPPPLLPSHPPTNTNTHTRPPPTGPLLFSLINTHTGPPPQPTTPHYPPSNTHTYPPPTAPLCPPINNHICPPSPTTSYPPDNYTYTSKPPINNHIRPPLTTPRYSPNNHSCTYVKPTAIQEHLSTRTAPLCPYPPPVVPQFTLTNLNTHHQQPKRPQKQLELITQEFPNHKTNDATLLPIIPTTITPRPLEQLNNKDKIMNRIGNNIDDVLQNLKLKMLNTPSDGHCLLHAVSLSYSSQLETTLTKDDVHLRTRLKATIKAAKYALHFELTESYSDGMFRYFNDKEYNNDFGDVVPYIICDALQINIVIIDSTNKEHIKTVSIAPTEQNTCTTLETIHIHYKNEHYSGLLRTTSTPRTNKIIPGDISNVKPTKTTLTAKLRQTKPTPHTSKPHT